MYESLKRTNPGWQFVIGLVDRNDKHADLSFLDCEIVEVDQLSIDGFFRMVEKYTIVELLTSAKPYYFSWLFDRYPSAENIVYFAPDIIVFQPLTRLDESLKTFDIILTPHCTAPVNDNCLPSELHVMQTGIFNLGFIAVKRSANTRRMLEWWQSRLKDQCVIDLSRGLFVDQLWANLMPAYFDKVLIEKYPGYNMAHWNLHERRLTKSGDAYLVNGEPLVFFHFSHYSPAHPGVIAAHHNRFSFKTRPDLAEIFDVYKASLEKYHYFKLKDQPCFYLNNEKKKKRRREIEGFLRQALPDKLKGKLKTIFNLGSG